MAQYSPEAARKLPLVRCVRKPYPGKMAHQMVGRTCLVMQYDRLQGWMVAQVIPL